MLYTESILIQQNQVCKYFICKMKKDLLSYHGSLSNASLLLFFISSNILKILQQN